jgi:hypothetical protein
MFDKKLTNEEKLDEIYKLTLENHEMLKTLRRQTYIAGAFRILYWLMILGALGGTYYYVRPFVNTFSTNSAKIENTLFQLNQIKSQVQDPGVLNQLLEGFQKSATSGQ